MTSLRTVYEGPSDAEPRPEPAIDRKWAGRSVGRYVVIGRIGSGGMGEVFRAEDPRLNREVALKLVRKQGRESEGTDAEARLAREARAMAKLAHPNVVPVYDVGVVDDELFIAMEYVRGVTLQDWLADRGRSWREVLDVFRDAGRGLAVAHAAGLVHRDFKPGNVMIGDDGRVRVLDFGLARSLAEHAPEGADATPGSQSGSFSSEDALTIPGVAIGTPAYMALEQHYGQAPDARSDQFSFCASLYEGVFGTRPFKGKNLARLAKAKLDADFCAPPAARRVPRWLKAAIVRGLQAEPEARWPSMDALLAELDRHRRRRAVVAGGVAGCFALAAGVYGYAVSGHECEAAETQLAGIWNEDREGRARAAFGAVGLEYAPEAWSHVEARLDAYTGEWSRTYVEACEATFVDGVQPEAVLDRRMACLGRRLHLLDALVSVFEHADADVVERAVQSAFGLPEVARCSDIDSLMARVPPPEDPGLAATVAGLREDLARVQALTKAGKYDEAIALARDVERRATPAGFGPIEAEARLRLGSLAAKLGRYEEAEAALSQAYWTASGSRHDEIAVEAAADLVYVLGSERGRYDDAIEWGKHGQAALERLDSFPLGEGGLMTGLGLTYRDQARLEEALAAYQRARDAYERLGEAGAPFVAKAISGIGTVLLLLDRHEEALEHFESALTIDEAARGSHDPAIGVHLGNLAAFHARRGDIHKARELFERTLSVFERAFGPGHPRVTKSRMNLGQILVGLGNLDGAREQLEPVIAELVRLHGFHHPELGVALNGLAQVAIPQGRFAEARALSQRAVAVWEVVHGEQHPRVAVALDNLAQVERLTGSTDVARSLMERALAIEAGVYGLEHPEYAITLGNVGILLTDLGEATEAQNNLERALAILEGKLPPIHLQVRTFLAALGQLHLNAKAYGLARERYQGALDNSEAAPQDALLADILRGLGEVELAERNTPRSLELAERAVVIHRSSPSDPFMAGSAHHVHARALWAAGRSTEAIQAALRAQQSFQAAGPVGVASHRRVATWLARHSPR